MKYRAKHDVCGARSMAVRAAGVASAAMMMSLLASSARADYIWVGGNSGDSGSWSEANNWSTATAPTASPVASNSGGTMSGTTSTSIDIGTQYATSYATVTYDVATVVSTSGAMEIASGYTLTATGNEGTLVLDNGYLSATLTGVPNGQTGLANNGTINFTGGNGTSWEIILGGKSGVGSTPAGFSTNTGIIESSGGGTLTLNQNTNTGINNAGGLIQAINDSTLALGNPQIVGGTVATQAGSTLIVSGSAYGQTFEAVTMNNSGTFTSSTSVGGANSNSGTVQMVTSSDVGSSLNNSGTVNVLFADTAAAYGGTNLGIGSITGAGNDDKTNGFGDGSSLDNTGTIYVTNNATFATAAHSELDFNTKGSITNDGTIAVSTTSSHGSTASINLGQSTTIGGTGAITFSGPSQYNYVAAMYSQATGANANPTLTLGSGQTVSGSLYLGYNPNNTAGYNPLAIVNNGAILANTAGAGNAITIGTLNQNSFTNNGKVSVENGCFIYSNDTVLTFATGSTFAAQIDSGSPGSSGELLFNNTVGTLVLSGSVMLDVSDTGSSTLPAGDMFTLVSTDGGSISGMFNGLGEGDDVLVGDNTFQISYADGNVTLTSVVPEPASAALMGLGTVMLLTRRRRRRGASAPAY